MTSLWVGHRPSISRGATTTRALLALLDGLPDVDVSRCVSDRVLPLLVTRRGGWVKSAISSSDPEAPSHSSLHLKATPPNVGCSFHQMPPSRQEGRKAERDALKRAPSKAGAAGAGGAAAALATLNVNPLGH